MAANFAVQSALLACHSLPPCDVIFEIVLPEVGHFVVDICLWTRVLFLSHLFPFPPLPLSKNGDSNTRCASRQMVRDLSAIHLPSPVGCCGSATAVILSPVPQSLHGGRHLNVSHGVAVESSTKKYDACISIKHVIL